MAAPSELYRDSGQAVEQSGQFMRVANGLSTVFTLGDLEEQLYATLENLAEGTDETVELQAQLALIDQMMIEKVEGYVSVIRSLDAMADARKAEADRLKARAATARQHADFLRGRLLAHMQATPGKQRIETARFSLSIRQNPQSVLVTDASAVPGEYQRTKVEISVDKQAILAHVKATGEVVPGTEIVRTERLEVR